MISMDVGIWIGALLAIFMTSVLFKDSPFYRLAEAILVGGAVGNSLVYGIKNISELTTASINKGNFLVVIPFLMGLLMFTRLSPKATYRWPSIYAICVLTGIGTGLAFRGVISSQVLIPLSQSIVPIIGVDPKKTFDNIILIITTFTSILYFIFTAKEKGTVKYLNKVARYGMMIAFGSAMGSKVITFCASYLGVVSYILSDWLGLI
jgi:hypothetical protein